MLWFRAIFVFAFVSLCSGGALAANCTPGQYLPKNSSNCQKCPTVGNVYCRGGTYTKRNEDQGLSYCPSNGKPNSNRSGCIVTFGKTDMKYGPKGKKTAFDKQCWTKNTAQEYATCLFSTQHVFVPLTSHEEVQATVNTLQPALD